ncbi:uncharacterized protein K452DRAFT_341266 [Aplosporella prunicola CBS 121167]|uniref:Uncharacterized protein n=1 Tax=Aplosporella prunicola CBS 121167 TaxID=1176127 RepID=A0A6A6AZE1_9PEZI|nr:uncharacterized protein K452DRAFT_341266 [Aplosporella prunicola CBS 121167]KAF2137289.1 hypothetical protein K452DRAFT_341266 [Aplosporella prunicola CBS 121167]
MDQPRRSVSAHTTLDSEEVPPHFACRIRVLGNLKEHNLRMAEELLQSFGTEFIRRETDVDLNENDASSGEPRNNVLYLCGKLQSSCTITVSDHTENSVPSHMYTSTKTTTAFLPRDAMGAVNGSDSGGSDQDDRGSAIGGRVSLANLEVIGFDGRNNNAAGAVNDGASSDNDDSSSAIDDSVYSSDINSTSTVNGSIYSTPLTSPPTSSDGSTTSASSVPQGTHPHAQAPATQAQEVASSNDEAGVQSDEGFYEADDESDDQGDGSAHEADDEDDVQPDEGTHEVEDEVDVQADEANNEATNEALTEADDAPAVAVAEAAHEVVEEHTGDVDEPAVEVDEAVHEAVDETNYENDNTVYGNIPDEYFFEAERVDKELRRKPSCGGLQAEDA